MVWTLARLIELGQVGAAFCDDCGYSETIDPADFVPRAGFDCPLGEIVSRLRCGACSGRKITVQIHHRMNRRGETINTVPRKNPPWERGAG